MTALYGENFRDQQRASRYPFTDSSSLVANSGMTLATAVFLDASVYPIGAGPRLAVSQVVVTTTSVTIYIGDGDNDALAWTTINPLLPVDVYNFQDSLGRPVGIIVADPVQLAALTAWPEGTHTFAQGAADFVASCTIPNPAPGLLAVSDGTNTIGGDIWFIGEDGVVLTATENPTQIRVDVVGDPLFKRRNCASQGADTFITPSYLRTINQIGSDDFGNFTLAAAPFRVPGTILRISPVGANELRISISGPAIQQTIN